MKKTSKRDFSDRISEAIKDYLKEYLENIEFTMSFNNSQFIFFVKDVEVRSDLLKKLGIPLELSKGRVEQIKIIVRKNHLYYRYITILIILLRSLDYQNP